MKKINLILDGNEVKTDCEYIPFLDTQVEVVKTNFTGQDVAVKVSGIVDGALEIKCVCLLNKPTTCQIIRIPVRFTDDPEAVIDFLFNELEELKAEVEELKKDVATLQANLEE